MSGAHSSRLSLKRNREREVTSVAALHDMTDDFKDEEPVFRMPKKQCVDKSSIVARPRGKPKRTGTTSTTNTKIALQPSTRSKAQILVVDIDAEKEDDAKPKLQSQEAVGSHSQDQKAATSKLQSEETLASKLQEDNSNLQNKEEANSSLQRNEEDDSKLQNEEAHSKLQNKEEAHSNLQIENVQAKLEDQAENEATEEEDRTFLIELEKSLCSDDEKLCPCCKVIIPINLFSQHFKECLQQFKAGRRGSSRPRKQQSSSPEKKKDTDGVEQGTGVLPCAVCMKAFKSKAMRTSHMKSCAKEYKLSSEQLLLASRLLEERSQLGLPVISLAGGSGRGSKKREKESKDPDVMMALALSRSMAESEMERRAEHEERLLAMGLGHIVDQERQTAPILLPALGPSQPKLTKAKLKSRSRKANSVLATRTSGERERIISEKVAALLATEEQPRTSSWQNNTLGTQSRLSRYRDRGCRMWGAAASPSRPLEEYYVEDLVQYIPPQSVAVGGLLRRLSQIPGRLNITAKIHDEESSDSESDAGEQSVVDTYCTQLALAGLLGSQDDFSLTIDRTVVELDQAKPHNTSHSVSDSGNASQFDANTTFIAGLGFWHSQDPENNEQAKVDEAGESEGQTKGDEVFDAVSHAEVPSELDSENPAFRYFDLQSSNSRQAGAVELCDKVQEKERQNILHDSSNAVLIKQRDKECESLTKLQNSYDAPLIGQVENRECEVFDTALSRRFTSPVSDQQTAKASIQDSADNERTETCNDSLGDCDMRHSKEIAIDKSKDMRDDTGEDNDERNIKEISDRNYLCSEGRHGKEIGDKDVSDCMKADIDRDLVERLRKDKGNDNEGGNSEGSDNISKENPTKNYGRINCIIGDNLRHISNKDRNKSNKSDVSGEKDKSGGKNDGDSDEERVHQIVGSSQDYRSDQSHQLNVENMTENSEDDETLSDEKGKRSSEKKFVGMGSGDDKREANSNQKCEKESNRVNEKKSTYLSLRTTRYQRKSARNVGKNTDLINKIVYPEDSLRNNNKRDPNSELDPQDSGRNTNKIVDPEDNGASSSTTTNNNVATQETIPTKSNGKSKIGRNKLKGSTCVENHEKEDEMLASKYWTKSHENEWEDSSDCEVVEVFVRKGEEDSVESTNTSTLENQELHGSPDKHGKINRTTKDSNSESIDVNVVSGHSGISTEVQEVTRDEGNVSDNSADSHATEVFRDVGEAAKILNISENSGDSHATELFGLVNTATQMMTKRNRNISGMSGDSNATEVFTDVDFPAQNCTRRNRNMSGISVDSHATEEFTDVDTTAKILTEGDENISGMSGDSHVTEVFTDAKRKTKSNGNVCGTSGDSHAIEMLSDTTAKILTDSDGNLRDSHATEVFTEVDSADISGSSEDSDTTRIIVDMFGQMGDSNTCVAFPGTFKTDNSRNSEDSLATRIYTEEDVDFFSSPLQASTKLGISLDVCRTIPPCRLNKSENSTNVTSKADSKEPVKVSGRCKLTWGNKESESDVLSIVDPKINTKSQKSTNYPGKSQYLCQSGSKEIEDEFSSDIPVPRLQSNQSVYDHENSKADDIQDYTLTITDLVNKSDPKGYYGKGETGDICSGDRKGEHCDGKEKQVKVNKRNRKRQEEEYNSSDSREDRTKERKMEKGRSQDQKRNKERREESNSSGERREERNSSRERRESRSDGRRKEKTKSRERIDNKNTNNDRSRSNSGGKTEGKSLEIFKDYSKSYEGKPCTRNIEKKDKTEGRGSPGMLKKKNKEDDDKACKNPQGEGRVEAYCTNPTNIEMDKAGSETPPSFMHQLSMQDNLSKTWGEFLARGEHFDVTVSTATGTLQGAHSLVLLARCPQIYQEAVGAGMTITWEDTSPEAARAFIHYLYTGTCQVKERDDPLWIDVFDLALQYRCKDLLAFLEFLFKGDAAGKGSRVLKDTKTQKKRVLKDIETPKKKQCRTTQGQLSPPNVLSCVASFVKDQATHSYGSQSPDLFDISEVDRNQSLIPSATKSPAMVSVLTLSQKETGSVFSTNQGLPTLLSPDNINKDKELSLVLSSPSPQNSKAKIPSERPHKPISVCSRNAIERNLAEEFEAVGMEDSRASILQLQASSQEGSKRLQSDNNKNSSRSRTLSNKIKDISMSTHSQSEHEDDQQRSRSRYSQSHNRDNSKRSTQSQSDTLDNSMRSTHPQSDNEESKKISRYLQSRNHGISKRSTHAHSDSECSRKCSRQLQSDSDDGRKGQRHSQSHNEDSSKKQAQSGIQDSCKRSTQSQSDNEDSRMSSRHSQSHKEDNDKRRSQLDNLDNSKRSTHSQLNGKNSGKRSKYAHSDNHENSKGSSNSRSGSEDGSKRSKHTQSDSEAGRKRSEHSDKEESRSGSKHLHSDNEESNTRATHLQPEGNDDGRTDSNLIDLTLSDSEPVTETKKQRSNLRCGSEPSNFRKSSIISGGGGTLNNSEVCEGLERDLCDAAMDGHISNIWDDFDNVMCSESVPFDYLPTPVKSGQANDSPGKGENCSLTWISPQRNESLSKTASQKGDNTMNTTFDSPLKESENSWKAMQRTFESLLKSPSKQRSKNKRAPVNQFLDDRPSTSRLVTSPGSPIKESEHSWKSMQRKFESLQKSPSKQQRVREFPEDIPSTPGLIVSPGFPVIDLHSTPLDPDQLGSGVASETGPGDRTLAEAAAELECSLVLKEFEMEDDVYARENQKQGPRKSDCWRISNAQDEVETQNGNRGSAAGKTPEELMTPQGKPGPSKSSVTPMPDYSTMVTPRLKKELEKYGVRPIRRRKAVVLLKHLYEQTHPLVTDSEADTTFSDTPLATRTASKLPLTSAMTGKSGKAVEANTRDQGPGKKLAAAAKKTNAETANRKKTKDKQTSVGARRKREQSAEQGEKASCSRGKDREGEREWDSADEGSRGEAEGRSRESLKDNERLVEDTGKGSTGKGSGKSKSKESERDVESVTIRGESRRGGRRGGKSAATRVTKAASSRITGRGEKSTDEGEPDLLNSSQTSTSSNESSGIECFEESYALGAHDDGITSTQQVSLLSQVSGMIESDPELHQKVLLYQPFFIEDLQASLKANGVKCNMRNLMEVLDEQCITFRTQAGQRSRQRKRRSPQKKKSPAKSKKKSVPVEET